MHWLENGVLFRRLLPIFFLVLSWIPVAGAKDVAVISNKSNGVGSVTLAELVKVCKGQMTRWSDGKPVTFVMLDPTTPEMKIVLQKVYEMTPDEVKTLIATANHGRTNHPAIVVVGSNEEVVQKVQSMAGAVGVVDVYSITGSVAVLKVAGKSPLEQGYLLHGN